MSRRKNSTLLGLCLALALIVGGGCGQRPVYSHFEPVSSQGWQREDTLHFSCRVKKAKTYRALLSLRTTMRYPYTQLTVIAHQHAKAGTERRTDTLTLDITDQEGNVKGNGISIFHYGAMLKSVDLKAGDTLCIDICHGMSRHLLPGISDVGITVE